MATISMLGFPPGFRVLSRFVQSVIALVIGMSVLNPGAMARSSPESDAHEARGIINVSGSVTINGQGALAGQTLFADSTIATLANSESLIVLSNSARLNLLANTDVMVDSSKTSLTVTLRAGRILSRVPPGVFIDFTTADLSIKTTATEPVIFSLETNECGGTDISVSAGQLEARRAGQSLLLKAGETLSTAEGSAATNPGRPALSRKRNLGLLIGIGAAVAVMLAVALGDNDEDQENPGDFGGCVIVPSPGAPTGCP